MQPCASLACQRSELLEHHVCLCSRGALLHLHCKVDGDCSSNRAAWHTQTRLAMCACCGSIRGTQSKQALQASSCTKLCFACTRRCGVAAGGAVDRPGIAQVGPVAAGKPGLGKGASCSEQRRPRHEGQRVGARCPSVQSRSRQSNSGSNNSRVANTQNTLSPPRRRLSAEHEKFTREAGRLCLKRPDSDTSHSPIPESFHTFEAHCQSSWRLCWQRLLSRCIP